MPLSPPPTTQPPVIDPLSDELLSDSQAAKLLKVSPLSVWRYRTKGKQGVRLPAVPYGSGHVTTRACIQWWFAELQRVERQPRDPQPRRRKKIDPELERQCVEAGI